MGQILRGSADAKPLRESRVSELACAVTVKLHRRNHPFMIMTLSGQLCTGTGLKTGDLQTVLENVSGYESTKLHQAEIKLF